MTNIYKLQQKAIQDIKADINLGIYSEKEIQIRVLEKYGIGMQFTKNYLTTLREMCRISIDNGIIKPFKLIKKQNQEEKEMEVL